MQTVRRTLLFAAPALATLSTLSLGLAARANPSAAPAAPAGRVVLTISGRIKRANAGSGADARLDLDMAALEALPQRSFTTATPWYKEPTSFSGPLLRDVLALAGAEGSTLTAVALNDYKVDLPFEDAQRWNVILARLLNGKPMSTREKGPLFIVYPFHETAELRSERYYSRSAWQLRTLIVK